jgi:arabinogalactan oligomer/maltooligosaccharide transport system substrate-binding protein
VPWAVENVAMLTNTDLSPTCPATLDEAVANAKKLLDAGTATLGLAVQVGENGDPYHWYPLYSADGGYTFARNADGTYNIDDMGVGKDGSIAAGERLKKLAADGIVQASVSYDIARETFAAGKAPYFITGPWQIPEQTTALGDKLTVCPVPSWEGSEYTSQPFLGVRTFMQPAKAKNPLLASTFLNDAVMTTEFMDGMYSVDPRPPAWKESFDKAASDPFVKAFGEYGQAGIPMPAVPQMDNVFTDLGLAEFKILSGEDPATVLKQAGESINKANSELK